MSNNLGTIDSITTPIYDIDNTLISIIGFRDIQIADTGKLLNDLRSWSSQLFLQAINAQCIYGIEHVLGNLKVTFEAQKRNIMIANKPETELLLRLLCTNQISIALAVGGLKKGANGCFVMASTDKTVIGKLQSHLNESFTVDNSVLAQNKSKRKSIARFVGLNSDLRSEQFLKYLLEKGALI